MFLGTYTPKLDDKGRLTLPAKFRDALAGGLMVTKGQDHSLAVYPRAEFESWLDGRRRLPEQSGGAGFPAEPGRGHRRAASRRPGPDHVVVDHRRYASLSKDCVVIGSVDYLEIWDPTAWQSYQQTHEENFSAARDEALRDII